jgi:hypothetical protein
MLRAAQVSESMGKRITDFFRSDFGVLTLVATVRLLFHVATNGSYGFHRDELQTLDDARHLDWGFVAYPPITPLIGRLELILFGTSLIGFRVFSAIAVSLVMMLAGLMAKELGGRRHVQLLAAVAVGISPVSLIQGAVFQYVSFDYLWGVTATYSHRPAAEVGGCPLVGAHWRRPGPRHGDSLYDGVSGSRHCGCGAAHAGAAISA